MNTFAKRLKAARERLNLTQGELADKLGWGREKGQRKLSYYEQEKSRPSFETLEEIAEALRIMPADLAFGNSQVVQYQLTDTDPYRHQVNEPGFDLSRYNQFNAQAPLLSTKAEQLKSLSDKLKEWEGPTYPYGSLNQAPHIPNLNDVVFVIALGLANDPTIRSGAVVGIDKSIIDVEDGFLYGIIVGSLFMIRQLFNRPFDGVKAQCLNKSIAEDINLDASQTTYTIVGKVVSITNYY